MLFVLKESHPTKFVQTISQCSRRKSYRLSQGKEGKPGQGDDIDGDKESYQRLGEMQSGQRYNQEVHQEGITEEGFLELMRLFLQRDHPESNWVMLRSLGYFSFTLSFIHSFTHSLFDNSFNRSFIQSFIYSLFDNSPFHSLTL